jgi:hypothetical protein
VCLRGIVASGYLRFTQPVSQSDTGEDRTKAFIVAQVVPPEPGWSASRTISSTSPTFYAALKFLISPILIRAINVYTIIKYESICLFNRNMRFYFSQCIAVEGSRSGVRMLSVRLLSPAYVGEIKCVTAHIVEFCFDRQRKTF